MLPKKQHLAWTFIAISVHTHTHLFFSSRLLYRVFTVQMRGSLHIVSVIDVARMERNRRKKFQVLMFRRRLPKVDPQYEWDASQACVQCLYGTRATTTTAPQPLPSSILQKLHWKCINSPTEERMGCENQLERSRDYLIFAPFSFIPVWLTLWHILLLNSLVIPTQKQEGNRYWKVIILPNWAIEDLWFTSQGDSSVSYLQKRIKRGINTL